MTSAFSTKIGNVFWMAPETNEDIAGNPGRKSDVWSIGILILEMVMSREESYAFFSNPLNYLNRLCNKKELPQVPASLKNELLRWALSKALVYNPVNRASASDLKMGLSGATDIAETSEILQGLTVGQMEGTLTLNTKEELIACKGGMKEHEFVEVIVRWVDTASPSTEDVKKVWESVNCKELCKWLEGGVIRHVDRGLSLSRAVYKYSNYSWGLSTTDSNLLVRQGYFNLCSASRGNGATQCKMTNCSNNSHPCYMLTVHNDRYCVVDSECAEGGLVYYNKGQRGHKHSDSVIHYWLCLYLTSCVYTYHSLLTNSVEFINSKIKDFIQRYPGGYVCILLMFVPLHED